MAKIQLERHSARCLFSSTIMEKGGLMGKVASDKCHKWVFKEVNECEPNISNYWQSSFDAIPTEWTDQFNSGIQTIAVIQAGHGLLQLGSCKIIPEDLHFVLRMRHTFESLGYQSGFYLSQLFASNRTNSPCVPMKQPVGPSRPPAPIFNWSQRPLPSSTSVIASPNFQNAQLGPSHGKEDPRVYFHPHSNDAQMGEMMVDHDSDIKWPNGLSFFNALTARTDDAKLLFGSESLGNKPNQQHHQLVLGGENSNLAMSEASNSFEHHGHRNENNDDDHVNDYLSLESHTNNVRKMENKFKRSFTMPARVASSSSSSSLDHNQHQPVDYRNTQGGIYSDIMETFLE